MEKSCVLTNGEIAIRKWSTEGNGQGRREGGLGGQFPGPGHKGGPAAQGEDVLFYIYFIRSSSHKGGLGL